MRLNRFIINQSGRLLIERGWTLLPLSRTVSSQAGWRLKSSLASSTESTLIEDDLTIKQLPPRFLRASDPSNFDPVTLQRCDVSYNASNGKPIPATGKPSCYEIESCHLDEDDDEYRVTWSDGHKSEYTVDWVNEQLAHWNGSSLSSGRTLWTGLTEDQLRRSRDKTLNLTDLLTEAGMQKAIRSLHQYGILLVTNTPVDDNGAAIAAMASCLGGGKVKNQTTLLRHYLEGDDDGTIMLPRGTDGPLRTLYGTVWFTSSSTQYAGTSIADSAYGHEGLPLHSDMTYYQDTAGLQIFTMVQPAEIGGESIYCDGFAAAQRLREIHPEAFETLSNTVRRYRCVDLNTGWHLEARGPIISVHNGQIISIRHNDLDRLPDLPPYGLTEAETTEFYERLDDAHAAWDNILAQDDIRLVINMQKGDTIVVANQRCMHGRYSFKSSHNSPRIVTGCYVSKDEFYSRLRMEGYDIV